MPRCVTCNTRFYGSGRHCGLHRSNFRRSYTQEYYDYNNNSTYPGDTHFRTSAGTASTVARRHHHNNHNSAVALYDHNQNYISIPATNTLLAYTIAQTFASLQDTHVIESVAYDGRQVTVKANLEREKCLTCHGWFANREKLEDHHDEYPVGCELHGMCMRSDDAMWHATKERHDRCFVRGCQTWYREEGGWKTSVVRRHVRQCHL